MKLIARCGTQRGADWPIRLCRVPLGNHWLKVRGHPQPANCQFDPVEMSIDKVVLVPELSKEVPEGGRERAFQSVYELCVARQEPTLLVRIDEGHVHDLEQCHESPQAGVWSVLWLVTQ